MNRLGTALLAAIEAVVTVGVGVGIALVPLTLLWGFEYGLQVDWSVFWKAAGSVWLVGHGVDVTFTLGAAAAKSTGVTGAGDPIAVTLAALGFAIVTAWLGARAGRRFAETEHRVTGVLVGTGVVAALGLVLALSSTSAATQPSVWQAVVLPALWFGVPAAAMAEVCRRRRGAAADPVWRALATVLDRVPAVWRAAAGFALRAGTAATAVVVAAAGVVVGFLLLGSFAEVITLYEQSHAGFVGGIALTVGQLAFLPDLVGWATAWIVGPGFAIGTGSTVSPIATTLGPIPGIPVFGALPASGHAFGLVWVLVPVVAGFAVGGLLRGRLVRALGAADAAPVRALAGVGTGVLAGVLTGVVAWVSSGSLGPGRLTDVGPHPFVVGAFAALEVGVPAVVALAVGADLVRLPARERWHEDDVVDEPEGGSLIAALDRAGAGRTTDVHRFVVAEPSSGATEAHPDDDAAPAAPTATPERAAAPTPERPSAPRRRIPGVRYAEETEPVAFDDQVEPVPTDTPERHDTGPAPDADEDVELPAWARTDAPVARAVSSRSPEAGAADDPRVDDAAAPRVGGVAGLRARLRGAADGVLDRADGLRERAGDLRERAGAIRDRVTGADAERAVDDEPRRPERPDVAGARIDEQPAFPWRTEEFVAGDEDDEPAAPTPAPRHPGWDTTDQIADDELPWWRRPKA